MAKEKLKKGAGKPAPTYIGPAYLKGIQVGKTTVRPADWTTLDEVEEFLLAYPNLREWWNWESPDTATPQTEE